MTVQIPASLKTLLKVQAAQNDRPLSKQVLYCLKKASGWEEANGQITQK